ncbi:TetR/AcrR family transcriptional regulator [Acinetobacter sp. B5B]|uniref:TetR/AcrR family transcriptional regulator n=1 Tax=Acinetobacter baretiae TaxID=2605383 RepID=UPI0018C32E05|nr:TetR/AcrR family transcriptional regulator [Acinetobacter baretiae]MBF7682179.1 TetR/AcrR family transcriptional regulator [Acinetobacter baretiae]
MKKIEQPKKQPEVVRKRIIEQAIILASLKGVSSVSIQSVASGAGVTKGGVFHHFSSKNVLIHEMMIEIMHQLDAKVEHLIHLDQAEYGQFTRAYIQIALDIDETISPWNALAMTMLTENTFNSFWQKWIEMKLIQYKETDYCFDLEMIRLAADGLWLKNMTSTCEANDLVYAKNQLLNRTYSSC